MTGTAPPRAARDLGLDLARALAITAVVASHTFVDLVGPTGVQLLQWGGRAGVELFFALSGFLIGSILIRTAEQRLDPGAVGLFLLRRWLRTLPLYYAVLWAAGWFFGLQNVHAYLLLQNFYPGEPRVLPASWSLVMEEYFYLFFPLAMLPLTAVLGQGRRVVAATAGLLIAVCLTGRLLDAAGVYDVPLNMIHESPFMRMDCAAYGVVAALLMRAGPGRSWLTPRRAWGALALAVLLTGASAWAFVTVVSWSPAELVAHGFGSWGRYYLVMQWSPSGPVFATAVAALWALRIRLPRPLAVAVQRISLWSYSLYLLHPLVNAVVDYQGLARPGIGRAVLCVGISLLGSAATYYAIERPVLWLRDRWVPGPDPTGAVDQAARRNALPA